MASCRMLYSTPGSYLGKGPYTRFSVEKDRRGWLVCWGEGRIGRKAKSRGCRRVKSLKSAGALVKRQAKCSMDTRYRVKR